MNLKKTIATFVVVTSFGVGGGVTLDQVQKDLTVICDLTKESVIDLDTKLKDYAIDDGFLKTRVITADDRADIKGCEITKLVQKEKIERGQIDIEIVDIEPIDGGVQVFARAWKDDKQIGFGKDGTVDIERFRIFNPPILVPDEQGDVVKIIEANRELGIPQQEVKYREDPKEAILKVIESNLAVMKNIHDSSKIIPGKVGQTTSTIYAGAADEYVYETDITWAGVRSASGEGSSNVATILAVQASRESAVSWVIYRSPMPFDTSSIPDSDTISSASVVFVPQTNDETGADNQSMALDKVTTITPATGDFAIANWAGVDQATRELVTSFAVGVSDSLALNATGIANINKTGTTNFGFRYSFDMDNTTPVSTSAEMRTFPYASEQTGTTNDPRLVVEHAAGGGSSNLQPIFIFE